MLMNGHTSYGHASPDRLKNTTAYIDVNMAGRAEKRSCRDE